MRRLVLTCLLVALGGCNVVQHHHNTIHEPAPAGCTVRVVDSFAHDDRGVSYVNTKTVERSTVCEGE